jgi:hypothetical protein
MLRGFDGKCIVILSVAAVILSVAKDLSFYEIRDPSSQTALLRMTTYPKYHALVGGGSNRVFYLMRFLSQF